MARTLTQLMQTLPQEIYDEIFELTFTHNNKNQVQVRIDKNCGPPRLLQVCKQGRQLFAESYYSTTHFYAKDREVLHKWLLSLDKQHARYFCDIALIVPDSAFKMGFAGLTPTSVALSRASHAERQRIERTMKLKCRRALYQLKSTLGRAYRPKSASGRGTPLEGPAVLDLPIAALRLVIEGLCEMTLEEGSWRWYWRRDG